MSKDQAVGVVIMIGSILGILVYLYLIFLAPKEIQDMVLRLTGAIAVGGVLGILAWIGYTLATTPPPPSIEEIEKEIEKELKEIEKEEKKEEEKESKESEERKEES